MTNMPRLLASIAKSTSIIEELFVAITRSSDETLEDYQMELAQRFAAITEPFPDLTGIEAAVVSDDCTDEAKTAAMALNEFIGDLNNALSYQDFVQSSLDEICDNKVSVITTLTSESVIKLDGECGPDNLAES